MFDNLLIVQCSYEMNESDHPASQTEILSVKIDDFRLGNLLTAKSDIREIPQYVQ